MNEIIEYSLDCENALKNFNLAKWYYDKEHYSPAFSFFLRCSERSEDELLTYQSLILSVLCLDKIERRNASSQILLEHAICFLPKRPESHYLLCKLYEKKEDCQHLSYLTAHLALELCDFDLTPLPIDIGYPGKYAIVFQKAHMGYYLGKSKECRLLFRDLILNYEMNDEFKKVVENNLICLGCGPANVAFTPYESSKSEKLKFKFQGYDKIEKNYSQVYQDMFVLSAMNGKKNGTYLEIGGGDPLWGNNTFLLEKEFGWKGVSIEYQELLVNNYNQIRKNKAICKNALELDYEKLLGEHFESNIIDYLQLDCEPSKSTFEILLNIPFDKYKFSVITYEHDHFIDATQSYRTKSRNYLKLMGYELIVNDVGPTDWYSFEDWWIHPDLIDKKTIDNLKNIIEGVNQSEKYMLNIYT